MRLIKNQRPNGFKSINTVVGDIDVTVWYEYEEPVEGSRENGLQMEPDFDEVLDVHAVWVKDVNIISVLHEYQLGELEDDILNKLKSTNGWYA